MGLWDLDPEELSSLVKNRDVGDDALNLKHKGVKGIAEALRVDFKKGLSEEVSLSFHFQENARHSQNLTRLQEIEARRAHFGKNDLPEKPPKPWFSFWWEAMQDRTLQILSVAAIVSIILGVAVPAPGETRR